jgi:hypothetical protein
MEKKHIDLAFDALEVTGSDKLFKTVINIGRHNKIIGAFSDGDSDLYIVRIITPEFLIEITYYFEEDTVDINLVTINVLASVFKLGVHSLDDLMTLDRQIEVNK